VLDNLSTGHRWALPHDVPLFVGSTADQALTSAIMQAHEVRAVIHFAASIVVPDSMSDPLGYYGNNTAATRSLIESAVKSGVKHFIFSSTAAVYGNVAVTPVPEHAPTVPVSPYGTSKLMSELMLRDAALAHGLGFVVLRYFNVAGADPKGRTGQSTPNATHLIKVAVQTALGQRAGMEVFGTDYPTADGTCVRDYIHVTDLARAHSAALAHLRKGGQSGVFNCGYGQGFSVLDVIDTVKDVAGRDFAVKMSPRRPGDPASIVAGADRIREMLGWQPTLDNLRTIVQHAYEWEAKLARRNAA
jgi:UDP-glucose 4-epimerase